MVERRQQNSKESAGASHRRPGLPFLIETHPSFLIEDRTESLKKAGLFFVTMGIQSGSERIRGEIYRRKGSNRKIREAARLLKRKGVAYRIEFIFGNPLEEAEDMKENLKLLLELPRPCLINITNLTHFPASPLTERFLKDGIITPDDVHGYTENANPHWDIKVDLNDGRSAEYYFYMCLILIENIRYYHHEPYYHPARPHFYPRWLIKWMERREWLKRNPELMLSITKKMARFAHGAYFITAHLPRRIISKITTAARLARNGDFKTMAKALKNIGKINSG